jgi:hypothetical protein
LIKLTLSSFQPMPTVILFLGRDDAAVAAANPAGPQQRTGVTEP